MKQRVLTGCLALAVLLVCAPQVWAQCRGASAEKTVNVTDPTRARIFFDLSNITNSYASETISRATGLGYQRPSAILAPRTARIGFRFLW